MKRLLCAVAAAGAIALAPALAQDTKDAGAFGHKLTKGDKARYLLVLDMENSVEMMGMPQKIGQGFELNLLEEVVDVAGDVAKVSAKIERIAFKIDMGAMAMMGGKNQAYDSAKPAKEKAGKGEDEDDDGPGAGKMDGLGAAVGESFTFKIARDGTISEVQGLDKVNEKVMEKLGGGARGMGGGFPYLGPENMRALLEAHTHIFPAGGGSGDTWKLDAKLAVPMVGELAFARTMTVKGEGEAAGEKGAKIAQTSSKPTFTVKLPEGMNGGGDQMAAAMAALGKQKMKEGSFEGTAIFSKEKGRLVSSVLDETLVTEVSMKNPFAQKGKKKKGKATDEDDEDEAPKKKDEGSKEKGDEGADEGEMKITQNYKLKLRYELQTGEAPAAPKSEEKKAEPKKDEPKKDEKKEEPKKDKKGSF